MPMQAARRLTVLHIETTISAEATSPKFVAATRLFLRSREVGFARRETDHPAERRTPETWSVQSARPPGMPSPSKNTSLCWHRTAVLFRGV